MKLKPANYRARIIDKQIDNYLSIFGAVCIEGPKWCGKTWTSLSHAKSVIYIGDPKGNFQNRHLAQLDPSAVLFGETPRLVDEWQEVPALWDTIRAEVDRRGAKGQFIITGSSTPNTKGILHSGVGRIHTIKMRPMSLFESGDSTGKVSLLSLFENKIKTNLTSEVSLKELVNFVVRGGWPGAIGLESIHLGAITRSYLKVLIENDINKIDDVERDKNKISALIRSLARNESTLASKKVLLANINLHEKETVNITTIDKYLELLERLFIIENQNAFDPNYRSSVRVAKTPKRHFIDPSLAVAALGLSQEMLINDLSFFGFLFESLVIRDLKIYAESRGGNVFYYKHHDLQQEIDAVVELSDGRYIAIEIKLGANRIDEGAASLLKIKKHFESQTNVRKPVAYVVICGLSNSYYQREDGVIVVPITSLCP